MTTREGIAMSPQNMPSAANTSLCPFWPSGKPNFTSAQLRPGASIYYVTVSAFLCVACHLMLSLLQIAGISASSAKTILTTSLERDADTSFCPVRSLSYWGDGSLLLHAEFNQTMSPSQIL